jgi:hypothetical protein
MMIEVTQEDGNNYCRILTLLGMEEEGDAVAEVERLIALRDGAASQQGGRDVYIQQLENELKNALQSLLAAAQAPAATEPSDEVERIVRLRANRTRRVYIAGPMTGLPGFNFAAFNTKAAELRAEGWHVENPAEHGLIDGAERSDYLRWDISRIATCGAIYLLPGWEASKGAALEVHIGKALGVEFLGDEQVADSWEARHQRDVAAQAAHEEWWESRDMDKEFDLTTKNQSNASWCEATRRAALFAPPPVPQSGPVARTRLTDEQIRELCSQQPNSAAESIWFAGFRAALAATPTLEPVKEGVGLSDEQIEALAHRMAWRYKKSSDPHHSDTFTFNLTTLVQFARALAAVQGTT